MIKRDSNGRFIKGNMINQGRIPTKQQRKKQSLAMTGKYNGPLGEDHPFWKGDDVQYRALHEWVNKYLSKPNICQTCGEDKKLDLANITGDYKRDFKNWKYLCRKCHIISEGRLRNLKQYKDMYGGIETEYGEPIR